MLLSEPRDLNVTFAEPGENRSFGETLSDLGKVRVLPDLLSDEEVAARDEKMRRLFTAADNAQRLTGLMSSRREALADAAQARIDTVKAQTGVTLENPFRGGYAEEARARVSQTEFTGPGSAGAQRAVDEQVSVFNDRLMDVVSAMPDKEMAERLSQPLAEQARTIANAAEQEFQNASGDAPGPGEKLFGFLPTNGAWWLSSAPTMLLGGIWGSRRDPLSLASFVAGPATTTGKNVLSRIFVAGLRDSLFNAGQQIASEPAVQAWRAERGKEYGIVPALEDVGWAAALGFIPGVTIQGAREVAPALARIGKGTPERGDFETVSKALGNKIDPETKAMMAAADRTFAADDAAAKDVPPAVKPDAHDEATANASRFYEADEQGAPPELPSFREVEGEHLVRPAVIAGDAVYEGATHAEALARAEARGAPKGSSTEGFVTSEGRFVTGDEAMALDLAERPIMQKLSALNEEAREFVENGSVRPEVAAAMADLPMPPEHQAAVLRDVAAREPSTPEAARALAADRVERLGQQADRRRLDNETAPLPPPETAVRPDETVIERERLDTLDPTAPANNIRSTKTDALEAVPLTRDDGTLVMVKPEAVAAAGARDRLLADLTGACK